MKKLLFIPLLLLAIFTTACDDNKTRTPPEPPLVATKGITALPETAEAVHTEVPKSQEPDSHVPSTLPPEPQPLSFSAQDGQTLQGKFCPDALVSR